jgi:hypothetical protein
MISYISSKNYTNSGIEKRGPVIAILQAYANLRKNEHDSVLDFARFYKWLPRNLDAFLRIRASNADSKVA